MKANKRILPIILAAAFLTGCAGNGGDKGDFEGKASQKATEYVTSDEEAADEATSEDSIDDVSAQDKPQGGFADVGQKLSPEAGENEYTKATGEELSDGDSFESFVVDLDNDGTKEAFVAMGYEDEPDYRDEGDTSPYFRTKKVWFVDEHMVPTELKEFSNALLRAELSLAEMEDNVFVALNGYTGVDGIGMVYTVLEDNLHDAAFDAWPKGQKFFGGNNELIWVAESYGTNMEKENGIPSGHTYLPYRMLLFGGGFFASKAQVIDKEDVLKLGDIDLSKYDDKSSVEYILRSNNELDVNYTEEDDTSIDYFADMYMLSDDRKWNYFDEYRGNFDPFITYSSFYGMIEEEEYLADMYSRRQSTDSARDFTGDWTITNTHSSIGGDITITDQDQEKFSYTGDFSYFSHTGGDQGEAYFISDNMAICYQNDISEGYVVFYLQGDYLYVGGAGNYGEMGASVSSNGIYTKGEPVYTNKGKLDDVYTETELENIKAGMDSEDYNDVFLTSTEDGYVLCNIKYMADGTRCKYVEATVPTLGGLGYEAVVAQDGRIYILLHNYSQDVFYTNDANWTNRELPEVQ